MHNNEDASVFVFEPSMSNYLKVVNLLRGIRTNKSNFHLFSSAVTNCTQKSRHVFLYDRSGTSGGWYDKPFGEKTNEVDVAGVNLEFILRDSPRVGGLSFFSHLYLDIPTGIEEILESVKRI